MEGWGLLRESGARRTDFTRCWDRTVGWMVAGGPGPCPGGTGWRTCPLKETALSKHTKLLPCKLLPESAPLQQRVKSPSCKAAAVCTPLLHAPPTRCSDCEAQRPRGRAKRDSAKPTSNPPRGPRILGPQSLATCREPSDLATPPLPTATLSGVPPWKPSIPHPSLSLRTPKARPARTPECLHSRDPDSAPICSLLCP